SRAPAVALRAPGSFAGGRRPRRCAGISACHPARARRARRQAGGRARSGAVTVAALAARIGAGELSPREAVQASLDAIGSARGLNAFITVRGEEALAEAEHAPDGPLRGVPVAIKDVIDVAGERTTAASEILRENVATRDAEAVARLRAAGAIVVGKLNTHEFAFGALTTSPHFGPARNPWDPDRMCGGSSGGVGAAVPADLVPGALG